MQNRVVHVEYCIHSDHASQRTPFCVYIHTKFCMWFIFRVTFYVSTKFSWNKTHSAAYTYSERKKHLFNISRGFFFFLFSHPCFCYSLPSSSSSTHWNWTVNSHCLIFLMFFSSHFSTLQTIQLNEIEKARCFAAIKILAANSEWAHVARYTPLRWVIPNSLYISDIKI